MALPDFTTQDNTEYKTNIDSTAADHEARLTMAYGTIDTDGTIITSNGGITSARISEGLYRLTHSFGTLDYVVQITPEIIPTFSFYVNRQPDFVDVYFHDVASVAIDSKFNYSMTKY